MRENAQDFDFPPRKMLFPQLSGDPAEQKYDPARDKKDPAEQKYDPAELSGDLAENSEDPAKDSGALAEGLREQLKELQKPNLRIKHDLKMRHPR